MATDEDLEKLFSTIAKLRYDEYHPWRYIWFTFLNSIARGVGYILGVTIVLAILVFVLTKILAQFVDLPLIGSYFSQIIELLNSYLKVGRHVKPH